MEIKLQKKINGGTVSITIDEKDEKEALHKALFYLANDYCDNCNKQSPLKWQSNVAKTDNGEFLYIKRFCPLCKATSTAGTYQGDKGLFWKKFEVYKQAGTDPKLVESFNKNNPQYNG